MTSQAIHFGTSGWRGIIAEDFTFPGVRRASAAIAGHVLAQKKSPTLIVGYDTRSSPRNSHLPLRTCSAPMAAGPLCGERDADSGHRARDLHGKLDGGVNITASHNPAAYNGLKFSGPDGGPALPEAPRTSRSAPRRFESGTNHHEIKNDFPGIQPRERLFRAAPQNDSL